MEKTMELLTENSPLCYLLLIVLTLVYFIFKSPRNLPPGPFPWPIIGNILSMGNKPHISLTQLAKTHGSLMSLRLGTQLLVVASSSDAATEILKTHDKVLSARVVPHAHPAMPDGLDLTLSWSDCTEQWKILRSLYKTELFSNKMIESQAKTRDAKVREMVEFLRSQEGQVVRIGELAFNVILNTLTTICVSKDFIDLYGQSKDELKVYFRKYVHNISIPNMADYYTILSRSDPQGLNRKTGEIHDHLSGLWEASLKERRANKGNEASRHRDLLDRLLDRGLSQTQIDYLFVEIFLAGADTTTSTVEWGLTELIKNPDAMKKVLAELKREVKETVVKESDLPSLPYLHYVVKETLRLHPPAPFLLPRRALETCKVMNYTIPKGAQIFINAWAIGRDPKNWEEPLAFKPERFMETGSELNTTDFKFLPFGSGRRMCPGIPMASKQVSLILSCLLKCFDWSLPPGMHPTALDMEEKAGITLIKEKPLVLIPKIKI